jgi:hypothetical protein
MNCIEELLQSESDLERIDAKLSDLDSAIKEEDSRKKETVRAFGYFSKGKGIVDFNYFSKGLVSPLKLAPLEKNMAQQLKPMNVLDTKQAIKYLQEILDSIRLANESGIQLPEKANIASYRTSTHHLIKELIKQMDKEEGNNEEYDFSYGRKTLTYKKKRMFRKNQIDDIEENVVKY